MPKGKQPTKRAASIKEVAARAGVSVATVSRVVNSHENVSNSVRRKVQRAIEELSYSPNANARSLRGGSTRLVGVILRDAENTAFATLWKAAYDVAAAHDYQVLVMSSERDAGREAACIDIMLKNKVCGIVAFVADEDRSELKSPALEIPTVLVESSLAGVRADNVSSDNFEGSYQAVSYLLSLGHRKIEMLGGSMSRLPGRERIRGYQQAFEDHGIAFDPKAIWPISHIEGRDSELLKDRLLRKDRSTAIFAANAHVTIEALTLVREIGLSIPNDVSFIGYDNEAISELLTPKLTTVNRSIYQLGVSAVECLLQRVEDPKADIRTIRLPSRLTIRASCRALSGSDARAETSGRGKQAGTGDRRK